MVKTKVKKTGVKLFASFEKTIFVNPLNENSNDTYVVFDTEPLLNGSRQTIYSDYAILKPTPIHSDSGVIGNEARTTAFGKGPYLLRTKSGTSNILPVCHIGQKEFLTSFDLDDEKSSFSKRTDEFSTTMAENRTIFKSMCHEKKLYIFTGGLSSQLVGYVDVYMFHAPFDAAISGPSKKFPTGFREDFKAVCLGVVGNVNKDGTLSDADGDEIKAIDTPAILMHTGEIDKTQTEWQYMETLAHNDIRAVPVDVRMRDKCVELFYNNNQWEWSSTPAVNMANQKLWESIISDPFRCSLIDGAEIMPNTKSSINIGDLNPESNEISCKVVNSYPSGAPKVVHLTGLVYCPLTVYGQVVMSTPAASWVKGHEGSIREVTLAGVGELLSAFKISNAKSPQFWPSGAPRLLPNFMVNPGDVTDSNGDTINSGGDSNSNNNGIPPSSGGGSNNGVPSDNNSTTPAKKESPPNYSLRHATRVWSKWVNRWVLPQLQKRYPHAEMTEKDLMNYASMGTRFAADVDSYLVSHSLDAWHGAISGNNNPLVISREQKSMYDKADLKWLEKQFADIQTYWPELAVQYEWFMAEWPHEFGPAPGPPKGLQDQIILTNKYWDILAQGYNPLALFAIAAAEAAVCGYIYYYDKPLWYAPVALLGMFGSYAAYITYYFGKDEFKDGIEKDYNEIMGAYKTGKKDGSLMVKYSPYIITGVVGLSLTGLVVFETASTLGVAGSEVVGFEILAGLCITSAVEAGIWLNSEKKTIENKIKF